MKITTTLKDFNFNSFISLIEAGENQWESSVDSDGVRNWYDTDFWSSARFLIHSDRVEVLTAMSKFKYTIYKNGMMVYEGAYLGLLDQNILPSTISNHTFDKYDVVEATNYSGSLKGYRALREKKNEIGRKHPFCLKKDFEASVWHEALNA